jgi:hypothetical protein
LPTINPPLQESDHHQQPGERSNPPIGRSFIILFLGFIGGWEISYWGASHRYSWGRIASIAYWGGEIAAIVGLLQWYVTGFSWSWGWWL